MESKLLYGIDCQDFIDNNINHAMMKRIFTLFNMLFLSSLLCQAQTIWNGPTMTFSKANYADINLAENQDRISDSVWITRGDKMGIFNIAHEEYYDTTTFESPYGTLWAKGTTRDDLDTFTFHPWEELIALYGPPSLLDTNLILYLIADSVYIDIKFTLWQSMALGGGFSYDRSTNPNLSQKDLKSKSTYSIYPNPSQDFIQISGLKKSSNYKIFDILGRNISRGIIKAEDAIDIYPFDRGMYFIKLDDQSLSFIKQ